MNYQQLRRKLTKLTQFNRKRRLQRVSRFEQLEVRHLLAAAVWTNVLQPLDVSKDGGVISPIDALLVINELNLSAYAAPHQALPLEIADSLNPPFIDVTCDGFVSPLDALLVINRLNNRDAAPLSSPSAGQPTWQFQSSENSSTAGKYLFNTCAPQLVEGSSFTSQLSTHLTLPDNTTAIQVKFETPVFDRSSQQTVRDAFEILVLDDAGQPLVLPYSPGRDAAFNWSEGLSASSGPSTQYASGVATINLSGIAAGTSVHLVARLDNNDLDNTSSVILRSISFVDSQVAAPTSFSPRPQSSTQVTAPELAALVDVSGSLIANYGVTSISETDNSVLSTQLSIENAGTFSVTGQLIAAIDSISEPNVHVLHPDGFLQDGRPFFDLSSQLFDGTLAPGQTLSPRELSFQNSSGKRFSFHVSLLSNIASAPSGFTSVPLDSIEAGKRYHYVASANEPSQTPLRYSIVAGPEALIIDAVTGELNWQTSTNDAGNQSITIRATNKFGLSADQAFTIRVQQTLQNRPPVFTSTPGTEATAASGFEVLTLATGSGPTGLTAGDFGSGNTSLVAINAGDQSLSYIEGAASGKFANAETVSVGEPRPNDSVIRSSIGVDLGLPPYINPSRDQNFIDTFVSNDFNGDGVLDAVTIAYVRGNSTSGDYSETRYMIVNLGVGDGTFQAPTRYAYPSRTGNDEGALILAMDFDRDGKTDLLAVDRRSNGANPLYFSKGRGDGTFADIVRQNITTTFSNMRAADFNGDGKIDLLVQERQQNALGVLFGNGDGTFENTADIYTFPSGGFSIDAYGFGDVDGDSDLDIAIGDWGRSKITVLTNRGDKTFSIGADFPAQSPYASAGLAANPSAVFIGDFSGDGKADIAYGTYSQSNTGGGIGLYVGDGGGTQFIYQPAQTELLPYRLLSINRDATPVDIDRDGDLDLLLMSNSGSGGVHSGIVVGLNDGHGRFLTTNHLDSGNGNNQQNGASNNSLTVGAMLGDFNRDGMLDLLAAESNLAFSSDYSRLSVLLADQPGKLRAPTAMSLERAAFGSVAFLLTGDFNNDGVADVWGPQYQGVSITRLGNGDGTFRAGITATPYIGNETLGTGFVADLNNDGNQDVMWIGGGGIQGGPAPRYLAALGNGDGTFQISYAQSAVARTLDPGDFNHDGLIDFAARGDHNFVIMLNNPASPGTFTKSVQVTLDPTGEDSTAFEVNDFDGDGNLDVVAILTDSNRPPHRLQFFHGNGDGTVSAAITTSILSNTELLFPKWLSSADLNGDGIVDLVMTAAYSRAAVMLGNGDGTFDDPMVYVEGSFFASFGTDLLLRDVNGDGKLDMVNLDDTAGRGRLVIRLGAGDGTFGVQQAYDSVARSSTLASADFDNDGHEDFVLLNLDNYGEAVVFTGSRPGLSAVTSIDINSDGNLDVLAINDDNGHVKRLFGNGQGDFTRKPDLVVGAGPVSLATGDLNADGKVDFVTANRSGQSLSVMLADGSDSYTRGDLPLDAIPLDIQVADLNGDGKLDLAVVDSFHNTLQVLFGLGTGKFQSPKIKPLGDHPSSLTLSDIDNDGHLDAVITLPQSNRVMIMTGQGDGTFSTPQYVATRPSPEAQAVADLNQDGHVDLVVTLPTEDQVAVYFGIGSNRFAEPQYIHVGAQPNSVVLQDANHDGRLDILVTNSGDSTASVILNKYDPTKVYRYQAIAVDPDSDPVNYTIVSGPGGMIFDASTGEVRWAPSADQVGMQKVVLQASDGRGGLATQQFTLAVAPARDNTAPLFTSQPISNIAADSVLSYSAKAIDNDQDTLRYRLVSGPVGASVDPTTGRVEWDGRSGALKFNESNNNGGVQIPSSPSLNLSSFTIEGWFSFDATDNQTLIAKDAPLQYPFHGATYGLRYQWGNLQAIIGDGSSSGEVAAGMPWTPKLGQAYHIAGTFDAATGSLKLLINGTVVVETTTNKRIFNYDLPLVLGYANQDPFHGTMSNVRVWDAARSSTEILAGVDREYAPSTPHLIAEYRFTEGDAQSIVDASGHQLNGMFYGNGWPRRVMGIAPVTTADFTVSVEDGRGGIDQQSFQVHIVSRLRGNIAGTLFNDANSDGSRQSGEAALPGLVVYVDSNGNAQRDTSEATTTTDVNGQYLFTDLVVDEYQVRALPRAGVVAGAYVDATVVSQQTATANLPIVPLPLGQLRGSVQDDHARAAAHMQVFADLDHDSFLDPNEAVSWTDDFGKFALAGLAAGAYSVRVNSRPGWNTTSPKAAAHDVVLAGNATVDDLDFVVAPQNELNRNQPVIISTPRTSAQARVATSDFVFAYSPNGSVITYSLSVSPNGMVIDPSTGHIVWTPSVSQIGSQRVIVRAMDTNGSVALQDFSIEVAPPNSAPVVTSRPANPIAAGQAFRYAIEAQDAEQASLKYTMVTGPVGASVDLNTGVVSWTPSIASVGNHDFVVAVNDGVSGVTEHIFRLNVQSDLINTTPFVIHSPRDTASLLSKYLSRVDGLDATGQPLTAELRSGPTGLTLDSSGLIQWMPTSTQLGPQTVSVRYHSPTGSTEDHQFTITVKQVVGNIAPTIHSTPNVWATVSQLYSYDVVALDRDNDAVAFELIGGPAGMSINPANGTIRWLPADDQRGSATVTVRASDPQGGSATQTITLITRAVGGPPNITSTPPTEAVVGRGYLYRVVANDAETDPLSYSLLQAPTGMTIDARTGEVVWNPLSAQTGQQSVIISVSDSTGGASTQGFAIQVHAGAPNLPPVISSEPVVFSTVDQAYGYDLSAADPEGSKLTYSLRRNPAGMQVDSTTGRITWIPTAAQSGRTVVTVVATDAAGGSAVQSYELDILAANHGPTFVSTPPTSVYAGAVFKYDLVARDTDLDALSYEIVSGAPSGMTIDSIGRLRWTTTTSDIGAHTIQVRARDPRGGVATQTINFQVIADNVAPKVTVLPTPGGWPWDGPIVVFVSAVDNVAVADIELKVNNRIVPLDANHTARLSAEDWGLGTLNMVATARDAAGNVGTGTGVSFYRNPDVDYEANPAVPTAIVTSPALDASVVGMVRIAGTAGGPDFKEYRLSYARADQLSFTEFAHSTTKVSDGLLGTWDTTLLENDAYVIRLEVTDVIGSTNVVDVPVGLSGSLKLGNFRLSFEDMTIPVAGIPITIVRTYDTLRADRDGDFGYGWRLEYRNTDLRTSLPKSGLEDIGIYTPFKQGTKVYLTLPGGERQGFTFTPEFRVLPGFGKGNDLVIAFPRFTSDRGVTSTLSAGGGSLLVNEFGEMYTAGGIPWNPASEDFAGYTLTTLDGILYKIDGATGLMTSASDRNGNSLTFSPVGISSSSGVVVTFERGVHDRITAVTDANGKKIYYTYSNSGDLNRITDREGNVTQIQYRSDRQHYLDGVIDPLNRVGARAVYDANGRLTSTLNGSGQSVSFTYDPDNNIVVNRDPLGNTSVIEYDQQGNVVATTSPTGAETRFTFDENGNEVSRTDPLGRTTQRTFDPSGNITSVTDPLGFLTRYTYDNFGNSLAVVDPLGHDTKSQYDAKGNAIKITNSLGVSATSTSPLNGNQSISLPGGGQIQSYEGGLTASSTDARGAESNVTFDFNRNPLRRTTIVNGKSIVETSIYNANGQVTQQVNPLGAVVKIEYNANGETSAIIDPLNRRTEFNYDIDGRLISREFMDGTGETMAYDAAGRLIQQTDRGGRTTRFEYNSASELIRTILPDDTPSDDSDNPRFTTEYNLAGEITAEIDALGRRTSYERDRSGRIVRVITPDGSSTRSVFDPAGRQVATIDALGNQTNYEYDAADHVTNIIAVDGSQTKTVYDEAGRVSVRIDSGGRATRFAYTSGGLLASVVDPMENKTTHTYDELGRRISTTDSLGRTTRYEYDELANQIATELPNGQHSSTAYDLGGRITSETGFDGRTTTFTYDTVARTRLETRFDGSTVLFHYSPTGQLLSESESSGTIDYSYSARDRLLRRTGRDGLAIQYAYDLVDNIVQVQSPGGTTDITYDLRNRPSTVTDLAIGVTRYEYSENGLLAKTALPNGLTESREYTSAGQLASILTRNAANNVVASFKYEYDNVGRRSAMSELSGRRTDYQYDENDRLTTETVSNADQPTHTTSYQYDAIGNRTRRIDSVSGVTAYSYNSLDQLTLESGPNSSIERRYDAAGRLIAEIHGPTNQTNYVWNAAGQLASVEKTLNGGSVTSSYRYDAAGNMVARLQEGIETRFLVDVNRSYPEVLEEYKTDGTLVSRQIYGLQRIAEIASGGSRFFLADAIGTVRGLANSSGQIVATFQFDGFGNLIASTGTTPLLANLFGGERSDSLTQWTFLRARNYDPATGRFVSRDPMPGLPSVGASFNPYTYAFNDPVNRSDPSGESPLAEQLQAIALQGYIRYQQYVQLSSVQKSAQLLANVVFWAQVASGFNAFLSGYTGGTYAAGASKLTYNVLKVTNPFATFKEFKLDLGLSKGNDILSFGLAQAIKGNDKTTIKFGATLNLTKLHHDPKRAALDFILSLNGGLNRNLFEIKNVFKLEAYGRIGFPQHWEHSSGIDVFGNLAAGFDATIGPSLKFTVEIAPGLFLAMLGYKKTSALPD